MSEIDYTWLDDSERSIRFGGRYLRDQVPRVEDQFSSEEEGELLVYDEDYDEYYEDISPIMRREQSPGVSGVAEFSRYPFNAPRRLNHSIFPPRDYLPDPCFNCNSHSHQFMDCRQPVRGVFCYGCGQRGVFRLDCLRCNPSSIREVSKQHRTRTVSELASKPPKVKTCSISCQTDNRRVIRMIIYFRRRRLARRSIISSVIHSKPDKDNRLFAAVKVGGKKLGGLIDSGANISVLGHGCEQFLKDCGLKYHPFKTKVRTTSGTPESILGYVNVPVTFQDKTKKTRLYVAPSLSQTLYLGTNVWQGYFHFRGNT